MSETDRSLCLPVKTDEIHDTKSVLVFGLEVIVGIRTKILFAFFLHLYHETHFFELEIIVIENNCLNNGRDIRNDREPLTLYFDWISRSLEFTLKLLEPTCRCRVA